MPRKRFLAHSVDSQWRQHLRSAGSASRLMIGRLNTRRQCLRFLLAVKSEGPDGAHGKRLARRCSLFGRRSGVKRNAGKFLPAIQNARYHGLSCKEAARFVHRIGHCERCNHDGSESRLGVHHRDRDKHNQSIGNLEVLCHRCHMQEHAEAGETGWQVYHRKRGL